jgi:HPr kinase/phosphorylase
VIVHATTVAIDGRGVLIMGAAGAGKSGLALDLMAFGARLVADDRTMIAVSVDGLVASCPHSLQGMIEARGLGLLHAPFCDAALLHLCVDLDTTETQRLPPRRKIIFLDQPLDLVLASPHGHFAAALIHYVRYGRRDQE